LADGLVQPLTDSSLGEKPHDRLRAAVDSSIYYGQYVFIGGTRAWIGFWSAAWEEQKTSPLWIEFGNFNHVQPLVKHLRKQKGDQFVVRQQATGYTAASIAIPLAPEVDQEEAVAKAAEFVSAVKALIEGHKQV
jgi:hypothetical protein